MYQVIEKKDEEKVTMYMKLSKRELIAMLMENQRIVQNHVLIPQDFKQSSQSFSQNHFPKIQFWQSNR